MASRETAFVEITPEVLLKAYACGIFPMAESADDPALYWIEPEKRGIIPLDTLPHPGAARPHRALRPLQRRASTATSTRVLDGCAEPQPGRSAHLDQRAHPHALPQAVRHRPLPQRRGLRGRRAGRRPLRRVPRPRVLRREHVPPRARRLEGGAGASGRAAARPAASRCSTRSSSPTICKTFGAIEVPQRQLSQAAGSRAGRRSRLRRASPRRTDRREASTGAAVAQASPRQRRARSRGRSCTASARDRRRLAAAAGGGGAAAAACAAAAAAAAAAARCGGGAARRGAAGGASATAGGAPPLQSVSHTS